MAKKAVDYELLARLLEEEVEVLARTVDFYQQLAVALEKAKLPETSALLAGGARSQSELSRLAHLKQSFLKACGKDSLRALLSQEQPLRVRRLVSAKGREILELQRRIRVAGESIQLSLEALQRVNQRFNDFFRQLSPATIAYRGGGEMTNSVVFFSGVALDGVA